MEPANVSLLPFQYQLKALVYMEFLQPTNVCSCVKLYMTGTNDRPSTSCSSGWGGPSHPFPVSSALVTWFRLQIPTTSRGDFRARQADLQFWFSPDFSYGFEALFLCLSICSCSGNRILWMIGIDVKKHRALYTLRPPFTSKVYCGTHEIVSCTFPTPSMSFYTFYNFGIDSTVFGLGCQSGWNGFLSMSPECKRVKSM